MKHICMIFFALIATNAAIAQNYDQRERYLLQQVGDLSFPDRAKGQIEDGIEEYSRARKEVFEDLIDLVEDGEFSSSEWSRYANEGKRAVSKITGRMDSTYLNASSFSDLDDIKDWIEEEEDFFEELARLSVHTHANTIIRYKADMEEMTETLEKKWNQVILRLDSQADEKQEQYFDLIDELGDRYIRDVERAIDEYLSSHKKLETLADGTLRGKLLAEGVANRDVSKIVDAFKKKTTHAANTLTLLRQKLSASAIASRSFSSYDERMIDEYVEIKDDVSEFVQKNRKTIPDGAHDLAEKQLQRACREASSNGAQADCRVFSSEIMERLSDRLEDAETEYAAFVKANEGRFFGDIRKTVEGTLLEKDEWDRRAGEPQFDQLRRLVEEIEDLREPWLGSRFNSEVQSALKEELDASWEEFSDEHDDLLTKLTVKKVIEARRRLEREALD